jgi:tetratricopeptide (TPR) repeat protein
VLYASQSKYDAAKNALEMAIRTHPSYATAHENLGDLYAKMASLAYDKALALDSRNATAQTKLALIKDMMGTTQSGKPVAAAAKPTAAAVARAPAKVDAPKPPVPADKPAAAGIESAVTRWAEAWSKQDLDAYFAAYASGFSAPGMTRAQWEAQRRARIAAPKSIEVRLSDLKIEQQGDSASATFRQTYRSDRLSSTVTKTLKLALQNGQWSIVEEISR